MTLNYMEILIKLALGLFSLVFVINVTGKGNLAPNSATDQIQNYVLGGIIGGVIYNSSISILQYAVILMMWTILVLTLKWLNNNVRFVKRLIAVSYTHLTLPTTCTRCRSRWSPYH